MYVPSYFRIEDLGELHAFARQHSFATLVSQVDGAPFATPLPFLIDREGDALTLRAHMARANPQWRSLAAQDSLTIFSGPHAYVSAAWYERPLEDVPTWDYTTLHCYGRARIVDDPLAVRALVGRLADLHESALPQTEPRWSIEGLSNEAVDGMLRAIVAFEIPVARLDGKYKLSQNRTAEDRKRAHSGLARGNATSQDVASMMRRIEDV